MESKGQWLRLLGVAAAASALFVGTTSSGWAGSTTWRAQVHKANGKQISAVDAGQRNDTTSVTLVTGDRVLVSGKDYKRRGIVPGPGRKGIRFDSYVRDGRLQVVPSDARKLVRSGRLDERLFDVTGLIEQGYDDRHSKSVRLMVESSAAKLRGAGMRPTGELPVIGATATTVAKKDLAASWKRLLGTGGKVWLDGRRKVDLDQSVPQIGAPNAWDLGYTGKGQTVGIVDTGIDATHKDLAGKVVESKDFTGSGTKDNVGHGTHVASTVAGTGAASSGKYKGVAPDAKLLSAKVCAHEYCYESDMIEGMQWVSTTKKARVVNFSIGGEDFPGQDPLEKALNSLTKANGTLFVVSAGNYGDFGVESPASADAAVAVGAVDKQDKLAPFSAIGPRHGDNGIKPDLTAPGVGIAAARAAGTSMGKPVDASYTRADGTSMAAPHVSGSAALLAQLHPNWKAAQLKNALTGGAAPQPGQGLFEQGSGRVDIGRAITQNIVASTSALSFGTQLWPHNDDVAASRGLVYTNYGKDPVTLDLTSSMVDAQGNAAPDGALKLTLSRLVVPSGGTARVGVGSNTNHGGPDGQYTGVVTATSGDLRLVTPVAVLKEVESYDVTVVNLNRAGAKTDDASTRFASANGFGEVETKGGTGKIRLPKGDYVLETSIYEDTAYSLLVRPNLVVDKTMTLAADARVAKGVKVKVPRAGAIFKGIDISYGRSIGGYFLGGGVGSENAAGLYTANLGAGAPQNEFDWSVNTLHGQNTAISPYVYALHYAGTGKFITGFSKTIASDNELAKLTQYYAQGTAGSKLNGSVAPESGGYFGIWVPPGKSRIAYVTPGTWGSDLWQFSAAGDIEIEGLGWIRSYAQDKSYSYSWNKAPYGPSANYATRFSDARYGDVLIASVSVHADQAGNFLNTRIGTGTTTLYRDNVKIASSDRAGYIQTQIAAGPGRFRMSTEAKRNVSDFTTSMTASWTFNAGAATEEETPLATWAIRFTPSLDAFNKTPGGRLGVLPISMQANPGATVGTPTLSTLEISFDDGKTWAKAGFKPVGAGKWEAKPTYPSASKVKFVSLRASGKDSLGNVTSVKLIRAYGLK